jgi:bifunctional DNA-binding transcriptional regulator/antitoxin component of YhaV-PrlF toxin-antitoxin module
VTATLSSKGQLVFPALLRKQDHLAQGQTFEIERLDAGEYLVRRVPGESPRGLVDWLMECPEKGWFQSLESESTDTL